MPLLVSTPLQIFLVEENLSQVSILRSGDGYYFGITQKNDTVVISHSGGFLQYFRKNFQTARTSRHLHQPHQIEWAEDKILVTNTGRNCLSVYDENGGLERDVYLNEIRWDDKNLNRKGNHFNSVHKHGEKVFVVAHNYERPSEIWELNWPDLEVENIQVCDAGWAHNIWISDHGKVICDSKNNRLYNASKNETFWQSIEAGTLTRGLAVSDKYIFVGYSSFSERHDRFWKTGGLWIIDRNTQKTIKQIPIPGSGDINEIRLLDEADEAHNGCILKSEYLESIKSGSEIVNLAYNARKKYAFLQQNIFPISPIVRFVNIIPRWKYYFMN